MIRSNRSTIPVPIDSWVGGFQTWDTTGDLHLDCQESMALHEISRWVDPSDLICGPCQGDGIIYSIGVSSSLVKSMMFVATLRHSPELCLAREEFSRETTQWIHGLQNRAQELGVKVHGAYVCPNEHTFYFVLEADTFEPITSFLSGRILTHHTGHISPVLSLTTAADLLQ